MNINLYNKIQDEINYFINIFVKNGWTINEFKDGVEKQVEFDVNPSAVNTYCKNLISIYFKYNLLTYYKKDTGCVITPWIKCNIHIENNEYIEYINECPRLINVVEYIRLELDRIGLKPFFDEDSFYNIFCKPKENKNVGSVSTSFYLNIDYPGGFWCNHTL